MKRVRSVTIRYLLSRQESPLPIKLLTLIPIALNIRPTEFESVHIVWKTNGLPLTYSRFTINILLKQMQNFQNKIIVKAVTYMVKLDSIF